MGLNLGVTKELSNALRDRAVAEFQAEELQTNRDSKVIKPKVSIIILNWNSVHYLDVCLCSILRNSLLTPSEIIVVDNGSEDGAITFLKSNYPTVNLVVNKQNRGVGPARNQGIRLSSGKYILVLDVDTIVPIGTVNNLIQCMDKDEKVGLVGPKLVSPSGGLQYSCRKFPTITSKLFYRHLPPTLSHRFLADEELLFWDHAQPRCVGYVIGACQLIRRKAVQEVGLYDERIFYGPEDIDLCLRMWKAGWKVLYNPNAVVIHGEQRAARTIDKVFDRLFWEHLKGLLIYFSKHRYLFRRPSPESSSEKRARFRVGANRDFRTQ